MKVLARSPWRVFSSTKEIEDAVQRSDLGGSLADMDEDEDGCPKAKPDDA